MASRSIELLNPETGQKAQEIVRSCELNGVTLLIYCTLRSLEEQAKLFRQSRNTSEIEIQVKWYLNNGFDYLANILKGVGPQHGPHVTNAAPGESWHNYAMVSRAKIG